MWKSLALLALSLAGFSISAFAQQPAKPLHVLQAAITSKPVFSGSCVRESHRDPRVSDPSI